MTSDSRRALHDRELLIYDPELQNVYELHIMVFLDFLKSISVWGWFDVAFTLVVLIGVVGESDPIAFFWGKFALKDKSQPGFTMLAEWKAKKIKHFAERFVILGIAGELVCLAFTFHEGFLISKEISIVKANAAHANERAQVLESTNKVLALRIEELKNENLRFQTRLAPRSIDPKVFVERLVHVPLPATAEVIYQPGDNEAFMFALRVHDALGVPRGNMPGARWNTMPLRPIEERDVILRNWTNAPLSAKAGAWESGIGLLTKDPINPDLFFKAVGDPNTDVPIAAIQNAFLDAGPHHIGTIFPNTNLEAAVRIVIGPKL